MQWVIIIEWPKTLLHSSKLPWAREVISSKFVDKLGHTQTAGRGEKFDFTERSAVHLEGNWGVSLGHSKPARNKSDGKKYISKEVSYSYTESSLTHTLSYQRMGISYFRLTKYSAA